ncbi:hypothetical protein ALC57_02777 [Trachymyrmex cornetzi]|uniref:PDZ domain-containing protein n=1 Tax=Trachymyrmex cornetzi TaxID=471704 RepID=A0A195EHG5_9HYME|nr:hypothetical protein ALC57_02777 [Trachymyrmex cornetzi]
MRVRLHACVTSVRDDVGLRRAGLDIGGRLDGTRARQITTGKNGSAIDRKPSAGHYCAGLLSGDDTDDGMHSGLISVVKLPRTRASGLFDADNSRGRRRSSSSPSSSRKHRGEQVYQVIVFSQRDRKWRMWGGMLRIVKRTSERQSNNGTDVYIAICFSCPRMQRGKIDFELGQSIHGENFILIRSENQVAIYLIVTATSLVPEQDRNEPFYLAIFTYRGSVLSTTRVSNEGVLRDVEVPSRIRPTEVRQHGENLKRLELKSQLDMRRVVAGKKLIFLDLSEEISYESFVNPGSKAAQQGVREGDLISNINERSTRDLTNSEAHALLRNSGEQLKLGLNQENIGSPKRRIYRSSLQENTTEIQNSRDHHKDHNDNAHTDGVGEERCQ